MLKEERDIVLFDRGIGRLCALIVTCIIFLFLSPGPLIRFKLNLSPGVSSLILHFCFYPSHPFLLPRPHKMPVRLLWPFMPPLSGRW